MTRREEIVSAILGCSVPTYYKWQKEERPIIQLLNGYFSNADLIEFLDTNQISSLTTTNHMLFIAADQYLNFFSTIYNIPSYEDVYFDLLLALQNKGQVSFRTILQVMHDKNLDYQEFFVEKFANMNSFNKTFIESNLASDFQILYSILEEHDASFFIALHKLHIAMAKKNKIFSKEALKELGRFRVTELYSKLYLVNKKSRKEKELAKKLFGLLELLESNTHSNMFIDRFSQN